MKLIQLIILAFVLSLSTSLFSQEMKVAGTVYDTTGTKPVINAMVMAVRIKDSLLLDFTRTDINGDFTIDGFEVDTFSLIIEQSGFDEKTYYIFGNTENDEINISSVVLAPKSQEIAEVVIYAYKDPIYYRGDTLVYNADSFQVAENAVVEDLLKKLPGITVDKDGKITSQGQEIGKVLVDGDEFFGADPTIATKNLGADGIATVEIYEKDNDEGIGGDDEKIQVLDLKLKEDAKKGYFGRMSGATDFAFTPLDGEYGTNPFYEGELLLNKFDGAQKISVFALGSNTPRSNFGWGDMNKFGLENESSGGNRWNGGNTTNTSGIPQTLKAGVYYSDKIGKKKRTKIGFNYSYYNDRLDALSASRSQYFLADTTYFTDDTLSNYTENESHKFNIRFETQLDSLTLIEIKPSLSIDAGISDQNDITKFIGSDEILSLETSVGNINDSKGYSLSGMARINRKFMKKRREFEIRYDLSAIDNATDGFLLSRTNVLSDPLLNDTVDQSRINNNASTSHYTTVTYIEPIAKKFKLEFEYLFEYGLSTQDKQTFDIDNGNNLYNEGLSNIFDNTRLQNRGGLKLIYEAKKHTVRLGGKVRNIKIDNINQITDSIINQDITNFLPNFRYQFKPSMSKRFKVNYRTSSRQPSITDLQPIPDITNPNRIKEGNPDLKPNYSHSLNISYNSWKALTGQYIYLGGNVNYTDNAFASSTSYDSFGRTISQTVNVDGNIFASLYAGAGTKFFGDILNVRPGFNGSFNHYTNFINLEENITNSLALTPNLQISLVWDSLEIEMNGNYSYNNPESSLSSVSNTPFYIEEYSTGFDWRLKNGFRIGAEGVYSKNSQPGEGLSTTEFFVLNVEFSKSFLKTENLVIALIGNDVLDNNVNARREVAGNITTDYRTTIISRYFLLKATLRFNNRKTKEEDFNGMH